MKDREKILKAFNYLEKTKNESSKERFLKDCKILGKYIIEAYGENVIIKTEANLFLERIKNFAADIKKDKKTKFCKHCGKEIHADSLYCPECGTKVVLPAIYSLDTLSRKADTSSSWHGENKIYKTLSGDMVRSKSEIIIANLLYERGVPFKYEARLYTPDGAFGPLPDFTINWKGKKWYWEHLGMLGKEGYENRWNEKKEWYKKYGFYKNLITTEEREGLDSKKIERIIQKYFK